MEQKSHDSVSVTGLLPAALAASGFAEGGTAAVAFTTETEQLDVGRAALEGLHLDVSVAVFDVLESDAHGAVGAKPDEVARVALVLRQGLVDAELAIAEGLQEGLTVSSELVLGRWALVSVNPEAVAARPHLYATGTTDELEGAASLDENGAPAAWGSGSADTQSATGAHDLVELLEEFVLVNSGVLGSLGAHRATATGSRSRLPSSAW